MIRLPVLVLCILSGQLSAQVHDRLFEGRVTIPGPTVDGLAVGGAWVVLHRVGPDSSGPADSMCTRTDGSYRFRYRATGDSGAVYFVSTTRGGVSYFTPPSRESRVQGGQADLLVFDTTSAPVPISIRARHVVVTSPSTESPSTFTVIEAYEISNDTSVTRIALGREGLTFGAPLPAGVQRVTAGQGDVSPDAVIVQNGRVRVNAPLSPGLKQITFSYELPVSTSPLEFPVENSVPVLEVLVEHAAAIVEGSGLIAVEPVEIEGRPFRRFLARDVGAQTFTVHTPTTTSARDLRVMLVVTALGAAILLGLGTVFMRKGPAGLSLRRTDDPDELALALESLDASYERIAVPSDTEKAEHYVNRAQLKGRLSAALAKRDGLR